MWRDLVSRYCEKAEFFAPAGVEALAKAERGLGLGLPVALRDALLESDGYNGAFGLGLIWPVERIASDNAQFRSSAEFRTLYMPFDCLLFFGDAGNGDQFAFSVLEGGVLRDDIFVWDHENDSRVWVAPDLKTYLAWWLTGRIQL